MTRTLRQRHHRGHCDACHRTAFCLRRFGSRSLCAACLTVRDRIAQPA